MQYRDLVDTVMEFDFVHNEQRADSMIKAVLGHLASRLKEEHAGQFAAAMPPPLDLEKLRGHQINVTTISVDQFIGDIMQQFRITSDQAQRLIETILNQIKASIPLEKFRKWEQGLPAERVDFLEGVLR